MKALKVVTACVIILFAGSTIQTFAQQTDQKNPTFTHQTNNGERFGQFEKSLIFGLSSNIQGVIESSLYNAVHYKIEYPEFNSKDVERELIRVTNEGNNHSIKYKAYLALAYYQNQSRFDSPDVLFSLLDYRHQNEIFFYLQEQVQADQISSTMN